MPPVNPFRIVVESPVGPFAVAGSDRGISSAGFDPENGPLVSTPFSARVQSELEAYFAGNLQLFSVPVDLRGTEFQRKVWNYLMEIPYGATRHYGEAANSLGDKNLARAVGAACGQNPVPIFVPCHRIFGKDGNLVGFLGGIERKRFLLALESNQSSLF